MKMYSDDEDWKPRNEFSFIKIKEDAHIVRQLDKDLSQQYIEENDYVAIDTNQSARKCAAEIKNFDPSIHEAWIMQCPKGIHPEALLDKRIKLPGRRYVGELQVRASPYEQPKHQTVGYVKKRGKYDLRQIPVNGQIIVSKRLNLVKPGADVAEIAGPKPCGPKSFRLPVRHPFFGGNYKNHIEIDAITSKKLHRADKSCAKISSKMRRVGNFYTIRQKLLSSTKTLEEKEHEVRQSVLTGIKPMFMFDTEHPDYENFMGSTVKQHKKRKADVILETSNAVAEPEAIPKKKKRHYSDHVEADETDKSKKKLKVPKEEPI